MIPLLPPPAASLPFVILRAAQRNRGTLRHPLAKRSLDQGRRRRRNASAARCQTPASATGSCSRRPLGPPVCAAKTRLAGGNERTGKSGSDWTGVKQPLPGAGAHASVEKC